MAVAIPDNYSKRVPNPPVSDLSPSEKMQLEFGYLTSDKYLSVAKHNPDLPIAPTILDEPPYYIVLSTYVSYLMFIIVGNIKDFFGMWLFPDYYSAMVAKDGYPPWYSAFESFYPRRLKRRLDDCFARPIHGVPGRYIHCFNRTTADYNESFYYDGTSTPCLNLSSYNYLGFAQSVGKCTDDSVDALNKYGVGSCGPRNIIGNTDLHVKTEEILAKFLGQEAAVTFSMGWGTNAHLFTSLVNSKCLVISDSLNHASIRYGVRLSGAAVKVCPHNDMEALEKIIRDAISQGQSKTHRPWKKIFVCVEGLYSMEGTYANLPRILELRDQYGFYLFVDEAHSIGALGEHGGGICDYFGIDPKRIDVLMGTFTKSFGAAGGYISGSKELIDRLRLDISGNIHSESMPPAVLQQICTSMRIISGELNGNEGKERLQRIAFNSRYLRLGLKRLGFIVYGNEDSPVIPMLLYNPSKMPLFSRMLLKYGVAIVIVGYPATDIISSRVRFCMSAALTKEDIDKILAVCDHAGDKYYLKFSTGIAGGEKTPGDWKRGKAPRWSLEDVLAQTPEDCKGQTW
ncbi:serine C-palmitoyltransferase [Martiniozyma asiatica (nom. inval.)]|nr:serine C-palmitoyltransferase [Martiniozyma asiatica]